MVAAAAHVGHVQHETRAELLLNAYAPGLQVRTRLLRHGSIDAISDQAVYISLRMGGRNDAGRERIAQRGVEVRSQSAVERRHHVGDDVVRRDVVGTKAET